MKHALRFILIDDDQFTLIFVEKTIRDYYPNAEIITFIEANQALNYILLEYNTLKDHLYTVLITDLHMPQIDGFELIKRLEQTQNNVRNQLHIFVLSAAADPDEIRRVLLHSIVVGFFNKPVSNDTIQEMMKNIPYPY